MPLDTGGKAWGEDAPLGSPPDPEGYYLRYGVALTASVAKKHGVPPYKVAWAESLAPGSSPHQTTYRPAIEWAWANRPDLLGLTREQADSWDGVTTAQEYEDLLADGQIVAINVAYLADSLPSRPAPGEPVWVPPARQYRHFNPAPWAAGVSDARFRGYDFRLWDAAPDPELHRKLTREEVAAGLPFGTLVRCRWGFAGEGVFVIDASVPPGAAS